jgi:hypothetical protein
MEEISLQICDDDMLSRGNKTRWEHEYYTLKAAGMPVVFNQWYVNVTQGSLRITRDSSNKCTNYKWKDIKENK